MKEEKKERENKMVHEDVDWPKLVRDNSLAKQGVSILLNHHNMFCDTNLRKNNKQDLVTARIQM